MNEKDPLDKLNDQISDAPDIPDLKKKDKERKRAGAAWGGGRPAGTPFSGATGGSGAGGVQVAAGVGRAAVAGGPGGAAAAQGAAAAARAAASGVPGWLTALFPGSAGWLGTSASASFLSKAMIGIGMASLLAGVGLYAVLKLREKPAGPEGAGLAPIYDTIQIKRNASDKRLQMAAEAGRGQFQFDPQAEAAAEAAAPAEAAAAAEEKAEENPWGDILSAVQGPQGFAAQNLAGLPSGSSGKGSMGGLFSSLTGANSGGRAQGQTPSLRYPGQKGKLSGSMARGATRSRPASAMSTRKIRSGRAFAQLRYARSQSLVAARGGSSEQGMKATAADAFEQNATEDGQVSPIDSAVPANPSSSHGEYGSGTPALLSDPNALPDEMPSPPGAIDQGQYQNYQNPMDAIKQLAAMAAKLKLISIILIAIGVALIAAGCAMSPVGWGLIAAGVALVAMGIMMLMMAKQMGAQAQAMANQLQSAYGQEYQQENVDACVSQAIANGTSPDACRSPNPNPHYGDRASDASGVQEAVHNERSSNWEYDDGAPASQR
jgi:hypothetical protein